jgi:hypothetical protein
MLLNKESAKIGYMVSLNQVRRRISRTEPEILNSLRKIGQYGRLPEQTINRNQRFRKICSKQNAICMKKSQVKAKKEVNDWIEDGSMQPRH